MPDAEACLNWLDRSTGKRETSQGLLALADGRPLLARELYAGGGAEEIAGRNIGLEALLGGQITVSQAAELWSEADTDVFLEELMATLQKRLRALSPQGLRSKQARAAYGLLDEVTRLRRAVSAGTNPARQLLMDALLSKFHRELGSGCLDDNMQTLRGGTDP